jgi:hypothetical protein
MPRDLSRRAILPCLHRVADPQMQHLPAGVAAYVGSLSSTMVPAEKV